MRRVGTCGGREEGCVAVSARCLSVDFVDEGASGDHEGKDVRLLSEP